MTVLSLFDGMSCGRLAIERFGFEIDKYYASEISQPKIKASKNYFPDNIHIGDITKVSGHDYDIDILIGGSPCQGFSIMGDRLNFKDPRSGLIMDYFRILEESKPKYFLLENVPMDKQCEIEISRRLGVLPVKINSSLVSAQNRKRIYWTNIPGSGADLFSDEIEQPEDKGILLRDILQPESEIDEKYYLKKNVLEYLTKRLKLDGREKHFAINGEKARTLRKSYDRCWGSTLISDQFINKKQNGAGFKKNAEKSYTLNTVDRHAIIIDRPHGFNKGGIKEVKKTCPMTSSSWQDNHYILENYRVRKLTPKECCRLQTVPDNFFDGSDISDNQQYSCLGDGWTIDVICHILQGIK